MQKPLPYSPPCLRGELDAGSGGTATTRTSFESSTPEGYTAVTLATGGRVWGVPARYTSDSDPGTVAYMLLGELKGCDFANAEADRRSKVYIKTQSLGTLNDYESKTVCRKTGSRWLTSWPGVRITLLLFFDESSPSNTREAAYNETTEEYSIDTSTHSGEPDAADIPGGGDSFGVGDALPGVPTAGQLFPVSGWATEWSGVTFSATSDRSTTYLTFDDGGYITLKTGTRYTCRAAGGCRVGNGVISRGTFVTSTAFAPPPDPPAPPMSSTCAAGLVIQTDGSCDVVVGGSTVGTFSVSSTSGCLRIGGINICAGAGHNIQGSRFNQYLITFVANRRQDGSWEITRYSISL